MKSDDNQNPQVGAYINYVTNRNGSDKTIPLASLLLFLLLRLPGFASLIRRSKCPLRIRSHPHHHLHLHRRRLHELPFLPLPAPFRRSPRTRASVLRHDRLNPGRWRTVIEVSGCGCPFFRLFLGNLCWRLKVFEG